MGEWEEAGNGCTMDCVSCSHASVLSAGVGDFVKTDQTVAEVETDKVTKWAAFSWLFIFTILLIKYDARVCNFYTKNNLIKLFFFSFFSSLPFQSDNWLITFPCTFKLFILPFLPYVPVHSSLVYLVQVFLEQHLVLFFEQEKRIICLLVNFKLTTARILSCSSITFVGNDFLLVRGED